MSQEASKYYLEDSGAFVIENYNQTRAWSSFFSGIAGLFGIPLWVFYVNRGQCIASFGIRSKDEAIMEFLPANKAYQLTPSQGFRTFIKVKNGAKNIFYEPFSPAQNVVQADINNKMSIRPYDLTIHETNRALGLDVTVSYFTIPDAPFAGLVRTLTIKNTTRTVKNIEFLDGVSVLVPHGVNNWFLKEMSRTIEAWMTVTFPEKGIPVYKLSTDPRDTAQVAFVKGANFYMGFREGARCASAKIIVDPSQVFGALTDFSLPIEFLKDKTFSFPRSQAALNKMPCAFSYETALLKAGASLTLTSLIGHVFDIADIKRLGIARIDSAFIENKRQENQNLVTNITDRIFTVSSSQMFDAYAQQTYLDNVMRGGLPVSVASNGVKKSVYVYSRKHGDLERDYNRFFVAPTYFSEGEGNYRDVNQNRRSDVFFNPLVGEKNIVDFMNLIQLDGYNPLIFKGDRFIVAEDVFAKSPLAALVSGKEAAKLAHILSKPFVLGDVLKYMEESKMTLSCSLGTFVKELLQSASADEEAVFGEGYWTDHWTYNIDLLESFRAIYPGRMRELILEFGDFTYFDSHAFVKPRSERYCIQGGHVRQYHSVWVDDKKNVLIQKRSYAKNKVRVAMGGGAVLKTTLIDKLMCLIVNKLATLDPYGCGVEMEADKPGWYDALNGLPGLFGSSVSETFELKRLILLLKDILEKADITRHKEVPIVAPVAAFFAGLRDLLKSGMSDFDFWDRANALKEDYRLKVRPGVAGDFVPTTIFSILEFFDLALKKLDRGIAKSRDSKSGLYVTYFSYVPSKYENIDGRVVVQEFKQQRLPFFLEGLVHALRTQSSQAESIYKAVKKSPLWDKKLKMYKVNASLEKESFEIGRAKAFAPGWLENESIWLHMEYKYILELLKNGLYDAFYESFFQILVPFQKASVYGRSILENSSFIVSSAHPDVSLHGGGFVARLSGSTAEFIHMWLLMNVGAQPFFMDDSGELYLRLKPALSKKLFTKTACARSYTDVLNQHVERFFDANSYAFLFLGKTLVVYDNPKKKDTFGCTGVKPVRMKLYGPQGLIVEIEGDRVGAPYAQAVRSGAVNSIEVLLG